MREFDVGYNTADKNYGAVVFSKELSKEQCLLHLEDSKGTYCRITNQKKEDIDTLQAAYDPHTLQKARRGMETGYRVNHLRLERGSQGRTVVQFLYHMEVAQGSSRLWSTEPTHRGGHRLRDRSCFTLPALSAKGGRLETSTCPKGLVGAYQDRERAALRR